MVLIVDGTLSSDQFVLAETFRTHPELSIRIGKIVANGEKTVMPLCWARNVPVNQLLDTLEADSTVVDVELISEEEKEALYRMEWKDEIQFIIQVLTNSKATILDTIGTGDGWRFRALFPDRDSLAKTDEFCDTHGISVQITSLRSVDSDFANRYGLTGDQRDALVEAFKCGHFSVPREATLQECTEEVGISHQALSERLRRGTEALVEETLLFEAHDENSENATAGARGNETGQSV